MQQLVSSLTHLSDQNSLFSFIAAFKDSENFLKLLLLTFFRTLNLFQSTIAAMNLFSEYNLLENSNIFKKCLYDWTETHTIASPKH